MMAAFLISAIAALHGYILIMEMVLWQTARVRRIFGTTPDFAAATKTLAANQGLYNGFLAAGLIWALIAGVQGAGFAPALFFLACVTVAGVFGGLTVSRRIFAVQAVPALLALLALALGL